MPKHCPVFGEELSKGNGKRCFSRGTWKSLNQEQPHFGEQKGTNTDPFVGKITASQSISNLQIRSNIDGGDVGFKMGPGASYAGILTQTHNISKRNFIRVKSGLYYWHKRPIQRQVIIMIYFSQTVL